MSLQHIELLAPARDAAIGIEAILHGADAVYIGGPAFGARQMAGNSIEDIQRLCDFAHQYEAKVYVTLNTILYEEELPEVEQLIHRLYAIGVDALITQDYALHELQLPPIPLHASTQMDNCTVEQVQWLEAVGYQQVVLARELSLEQIKSIRAATSVPLEVFVHGALCVSYSGRCYASQHCFGRSANRGACAQFCRMKFDLLDDQGEVIVRDKHLLSLRDMNRSQSIETLMEAGVVSFKIEGRLKDMAYVKNVTAYYRECIDAVIAKHPTTYGRASYGRSRYTFKPDVHKSFNRGFTQYLLHQRTSDLWQFDTPKSIGEKAGQVVCKGRDFIVVKSPLTFHAGDGICYFDQDRTLQGLRVNKAEGNVLRFSPRADLQGIAVGTPLYRNADVAFDNVLQKPSAERRIALHIALRSVPEGFALDMHDEGGRAVTLTFAAAHQMARTPQRENIIRQLSKLGTTVFEAIDVQVLFDEAYFIPSSDLSQWRRQGVEALCRQPFADKESPEHHPLTGCVQPPLQRNVANTAAVTFLSRHGVKSISAFEFKGNNADGTPLMTCRHCLRYAFGLCSREQKGEANGRRIAALRLGDGRVFPLHFDCQRCEMTVNSSRP